MYIYINARRIQVHTNTKVLRARIYLIVSEDVFTITIIITRIPSHNLTEKTTSLMKCDVSS